MINDEAVERVKAFADRLPNGTIEDALYGAYPGTAPYYPTRDALIADLRHLLSRYERMEKALEWYGDQFCEHGPYSEVCGLCGPDDCAGCPARQALGASEVGAPNV